MKPSLFPHRMYNSAFEVDYDRLWNMGIRGLIFDIDNTLTGHGKPPEERSNRLIMELLDKGFKVIVLSNNKEPRVKRFCRETGIPYICSGAKPSSKGYKMAMNRIETKASSTAFIGDQVYTDILGARRAGIYAVLVKPLYRQEEPQIVLKRFLEKPVIGLYRMLRH